LPGLEFPSSRTGSSDKSSSPAAVSRLK
jgi:hypothetical protein